MRNIDPKSPGQSSQSDDFCDPHGHGVGSPSSGGHVGMGRDDEGNFSNKSMSRGGESEDGEAMIEKYRPGRGGGGSSDEIPSGANLNADGDGYDQSDLYAGPSRPANER